KAGFWNGDRTSRGGLPSLAVIWTNSTGFLFRPLPTFLVISDALRLTGGGAGAGAGVGGGGGGGTPQAPESRPGARGEPRGARGGDGGRRAGGGAGVDGRAAGQLGHGLGGAAVVGERSQAGCHADEVAPPVGEGEAGLAGDVAVLGGEDGSGRGEDIEAAGG